MVYEQTDKIHPFFHYMTFGVNSMTDKQVFRQ